jgi:hypothetical protein
MSELALTAYKKSGTQVVKNLEKVVDLRMEILDSDEVREGMYDLELRVAEAGTRTPIRALSDEELTAEISETIEFIVRDLGIKKWKGDDAAYDSSRFFKMLKDYYFKMSYRQVELAFELLMVGKLDEWLPKNAGGGADRGHYQSFSFEFVSKVLNAFVQYDRKLWSKARALLPEKTEEISDTDKREHREFFINDIWKKFYLYRDEEVPLNFLLPSLVIQEMQNQGVVSGRPQVLPDTYNDTKKRLQNSSVGFSEKISILKETESGRDHVMRVAQIEEDRKAIRAVFDQIIRQGLEIEDVIKIDYERD